MARKVKVNNAIDKGKNSKPEVQCAWTNEAFELWYLLHFNYYNTAISRAQYQSLLESEIKKSSGITGYKYQKNAVDMYQILERYGDQNFAMENAEKLEELYFDKKYSNHNPCTKVHILVKELIALTRKFKD